LLVFLLVAYSHILHFFTVLARKLLIELPTWLGDSVMASTAIKFISFNFPSAELHFFGTKVSTEYYKYFPNGKIILIDKRKNLLKFTGKLLELEKYDMFFSFRSSIRSKITKMAISADKKFQFAKSNINDIHQVERYINFIENSLNTSSNLFDKHLNYFLPNSFPRSSKKLTIGINPGANYGSSKMWEPEKFAEIIYHFDSHGVIIFGSDNDNELAEKICDLASKKGAKNFINLCGKTSVLDLTVHIKNLDVFITGDSGPMHIAAAVQTPTVSIFGSTNEKETSQWMNDRNILLKKDINCRPCMKRTCPLKHRDCMKKISSGEVIRAVEALF